VHQRVITVRTDAVFAMWDERTTGTYYNITILPLYLIDFVCLKKTSKITRIVNYSMRFTSHAIFPRDAQHQVIKA